MSGSLVIELGGPEPRDLRLLQTVRLVVARAGAKDSLGWWQDEALTHGGLFVLDKLFPSTSRRVARDLVLRAARGRHLAALGVDPEIMHLFHFGDAVEQAAQTQEPDVGEPPREPIASPEDLRSALDEMFSGSVDVRFSPDSGGAVEVGVGADGSVVQFAVALEALSRAYELGRHGGPVFPYLRGRVVVADDS